MKERTLHRLPQKYFGKLVVYFIILRLASISPCSKSNPKARIESKNIFNNKLLKLFANKENNKDAVKSVI